MYPQTFEELLTLSSAELSECDIARVNLLCATGPRGAQHLDIEACIRKIGVWTEEVRQFTAFNFLHYTPHTTRDTPGFLRCWSLVKLLRHHKGLQHTLTPPDFMPGDRIVVKNKTGYGKDSCYYNSDAVFIHGLLGETKLGLCTTFPVLYAAVGRRLGYPLKLALSVSHVLNIWDEPADRFNIDAGKFHISVEPNEYYMDTPYPWSDEEKNSGAMLRPLTRVEELGTFVGWRAVHMFVNGHLDEAAELCETAMKLFPQNTVHPWVAHRIEEQRVHIFMEKDGWGYEPESDSYDTEPSTIENN